jgi:hypothetical protein
MSKTKFSEESVAYKSIQPLLILAGLILVAYVAYRAYVAIQSGIRYPPTYLDHDMLTLG